MQIPEEFRCCICLSTPEQSLLTQCPHRVCATCADSGGLTACPVCRAELPADRPLDEAFARHVAESVIRCDCGVEVPVLEAEAHSCESTRKRKRPSVVPPSATRRPPVTPNRSTFACPLCDERNLTSQGLMEHCERVHMSGGRGGPVSATCPICLAMPWGDPTYVSRDFISHLRLRHRCDYTVLTDFEADEEAMLRRALRDSMCSAGYEQELEEEERILAEVLEQSAQEVPGSLDEDITDGAPEAEEPRGPRGRAGTSGSSDGSDSAAGWGHDGADDHSEDTATTEEASESIGSREDMQSVGAVVEMAPTVA